MKRWLLALMACSWLPAAAVAAEPRWAPSREAAVESSLVSPKISPRLATAKAGDAVRVLIVLRAPAPKAAPITSLDRVRRIGRAFDEARRRAKTAGAGVAAHLDRLGVPYRAFQNVPVIVATVPTPTIAALAQRDDVLRITTDPVVQFRGARKDPGPQAQPKTATPGVQAIGATTLWAQGFRGAGIVVGGADTGYLATHAALRDAYRGYDADSNSWLHDYNWYDGVREPIQPSENLACPPASEIPCDDNGHGTHTMGTMVGASGPSEFGVAPDAKWIGCRNMDRGRGTPSSYLECFEWFLAPTTRAGNNPDPAKAPHVINNSWTCPPSEGCDAEHIALLREATTLLEAAGIVVVAAAGNAGPTCGTINSPPGTFAHVLTVGASGSNGTIASFSSRGPAIDVGGYVLKPDVTAPGVGISSAGVPSGVTTMSGTSMATPHVAGAVALMMDALPSLIGEPALVRSLLRATAVPRADAQSCGGYSGASVPNAVYGTGFIDVPAAVALGGDFISSDGFE